MSRMFERIWHTQNTLFALWFALWFVAVRYGWDSWIAIPGIMHKIRHPVLPYRPIDWSKVYESKIYESKSKVSKQRNEETKPLPNIILIVADDLGVGDLWIAPHIRSIGENGATLTQAYAGQATCAPSRAALFSGRPTAQTGFEFTPFPKNMIWIFYWFERHIVRPTLFNLEKLRTLIPFQEMAMPARFPLLSEQLLPYGYYNTLLGKWHLGETAGFTPLDRGFHQSLGFLYGGSMYANANNRSIITSRTPDLLDRMLHANLPYSVVYNNGPRFEPNEYLTDYLTNNAVDIITHSPMSVPFFMTLAYNAPHNPFQALVSDYAAPELDGIQDQHQRVYYAMIRALDRGVGRVLDALRSTGRYEDTIVVVTSDNGGTHYAKNDQVNQPYSGYKGTYFEGGIRVPLMLQYPRSIAPGTVIRKMVHHIDVVPTLLRLVRSCFTDFGSKEDQEKGLKDLKDLKENQEKGLKDLKEDQEKGLKGIDLLDATQKRTYLFWRSGHYLCLRYHQWKLMVSERPLQQWLYHLRSDPEERYNWLDQPNNHSHSHPLVIYSLYKRMYDKLVYYNQTAVQPIWDTVVEHAIPIRKTEIQTPDDEYVYWAN